eukprot:UN28965
MADGGDTSEDEISPEEKQKLCKKFITNAPCAQADLVAKDLQAIVGKDILTEAIIEESLQVANEKLCTFLSDTEKSTDSSKTILCDLSKDGKKSYKNPAQGTIANLENFTIEGLKKFKTEKLDEEKSDLHTALEKTMGKMVGQYYQSMGHASHAVSIFSDDSALNAVISAKNVNLGNFWCGNWISVHKIDLEGNKIKGKVTIQVHYFESGNVQLNTEFSKEVGVSISGSEEKSAETISNAICKMENDFHKALQEFFSRN